MKRIKNKPIDLLYHYVFDNNLEEIQKLIENDPNILSQKHKGHLPLNYAVSLKRVNFETIKFLIDKSKDLLKNDFNTNLYRIALERKDLEIFEYLVENIPFYKVDDSGKMKEFDGELFKDLVRCEYLPVDESKLLLRKLDFIEDDEVANKIHNVYKINGGFYTSDSNGKISVFDKIFKYLGRSSHFPNNNANLLFKKITYIEGKIYNFYEVDSSGNITKCNDELLKYLEFSDHYPINEAKLLFSKINFSEDRVAGEEFYTYLINKFYDSIMFRAEYPLTKLLLEQPNINVDKVVKDGKTAIMLAILKHNMSLFNLFIDRINPNINDGNGNNALIIATTYPNTNILLSKYYEKYYRETREIISKLLKRDADTSVVDAGGNTPLMIAITNHNLAIFNLLIDRTDLKIKSKGGNTALTLVIKNFLRNELRTEDKKANTEIRRSMLEKILTCNLDFNVVDSRGDTCLMMAIINHNEEVFNLLVNKTNLNLKNNKGENALMLAAKLSSNSKYSALGIKMFKALLIHEANIPEDSEISSLTNDEILQNIIKDIEKAKLTLKDKCAKENIDNSQLISLIQYYLKNEFKSDDSNNNVEIIRLMIQKIITYDLDFNTPDAEGNTCLMLAIRNHNIEIFELLINKTDLELRNSSGENALSLAVNLCNRDEYLAYGIKMLKEILIHGVEIPDDFYTNKEIKNNEVKNLLESANAASLLLENVYNEVKIEDADVFYERFKYFLNKNGLIVNGEKIDIRFYINKLEKNSGVSELLKKKISDLFANKQVKDTELFFSSCEKQQTQKMEIESNDDSSQKTDDITSQLEGDTFEEKVIIVSETLTQRDNLYHCVANEMRGTCHIFGSKDYNSNISLPSSNITGDCSDHSDC